MAPDAHASLRFCVENNKCDIVGWFMMRASCLESFLQQLTRGAPEAGFCSCCSFTTTDTILNALFQMQNPTAESFSLQDCFAPRPQTGHWFPAVRFTGRSRAWNLVHGAGVQLAFDTKMTIPPSRMATICVQMAAAVNWPDGFRTTTLGSCAFKPAQMTGHDIKRGAVIELAYGGAFAVTEITDRFYHCTDRSQCWTDRYGLNPSVLCD